MTTTQNYGLTQYGPTDQTKWITHYNADMKAIDDALKAIKDEADASVPNTQKIAGLAMNADITLAQLISAGLCPAPESGAWTPIIYGRTTAGSPTYTTQSGKYCKLGKFVHLEFDLVVSALGGATGQIMIGGQPFVNQDEAGGIIGYSTISDSIGATKLDMWKGSMFLRYGNDLNVIDTTAAAFSLLGCTIDYLTV